MAFESDQDCATISPSKSRACHGSLTVLVQRWKEGDLWGQCLCPSPPSAACAPATPRALLTSWASCHIPAGGSCQSDELDCQSETQKTARVYFTSWRKPAAPTLNRTTPVTMAALRPLAEHRRSGTSYDSRLSLHCEPWEGRSGDCFLSLKS